MYHFTQKFWRGWSKNWGLERRERRHWVVHELLPNLVVWFGQPAGIQNAIVEVW